MENKINAPYKFAVVIGVDGMGAYCKDADTVNIDRIFEKGAVSYNCQSVYRTISAQCWGSMLMGVSPDTHGLTNQIIIADPNASGYPTVFKLLSEQHPDSHSASFCCWNPINHGIIEDLPNVTREKVGDGAMGERVEAYIKEKGVPEFLFIQMNSIDAAGHALGYGTPEYLAKITEIDAYIGDVYNAYVNAGVIGDTLFMLTADHGGINTAHGGDSPEEMNVYFGAAGHTVNNTVLGPMCIQDIPAIICYALGIEGAEWDSHVPEDLFVK